MGRKRPTKAQLRRRYAAAGWAGLGLLSGLALAVGLWAFAPGPSAVTDQRQAVRSPDPPAASPAESTPAEAPAAHEYEGEAPPAGGESGPPPGPPEPGLADRGPRAAIIIDDLGNNWGEARAVSALPYPVAVAVLPDTPYAARTARRAHAEGKEVLAHMPMQPSDPSLGLGGTFLRVGMGREQLVATLRANLADIPHVQGINNHMGSLLTAREEPMRWVMQTLRERGLYFVDSRTSAATQGLSQARASGIPAAERDVFLDHQTSEAAIRAQFRELLSEAKAQGTAIAIGHPHPATLRVLRDMLPRASRQGVEIVPLREVLAVRNPRARRNGALAYHAEPDQATGGTP
jgi:hypothetical protein